ncbi:MAG TPA: chemotaxis protein CheW [Candidatus Brocadiia bacterium]|nr:chemotaxis protein CheW [Planctomycetota bacterium]MDO8094320.1 chemotaxis protein CheW [Candidatus Brocadiales bacterium]
MAVKQTTAAKDASSIKGKFLTFGLCGEEYGLEILKVREINCLMDITTVPQMPDYMKGVINLRGKVIPVIDLRLKFGLSKTEYTKETCIIVVDVQNTLVGIVVDTVSEVVDVNAEEIEQAPRMGQRVNTDFILGLAKIKDRVKILLAIDKVLRSDELEAAEQMAFSQS